MKRLSAFQKKQEELKGSVLCNDHATYYEMPAGSCTIAETSDNAEDPVECECCSTAIMRKLGAI